MNKTRLIIATFLCQCLFISTSFAESGRYQAHWDGKAFLIVDSSKGHLWTMRKDSMIYKGQIDGDEFEAPDTPQIWQLRHGKWTKN